MISNVRRLPFLVAVGIPLDSKNFDKPHKDFLYPKNDGETGWDRVKRIFITE